ncbi:MAG: stage IV sporulation protein A [Clostridiales bacterium]|nr:stage IV sporulation protein A [Clostridiales bacterium]
MGSIYEDIARRTDGCIYIGVVGPVRTGKSTFIKRFMETLVIPRIENVYVRERARDELPQSGSGRRVMTAEPKFVPEDAVRISMDDGSEFAVRLIDCVGYMVDGASGGTEDGEERMVTTPWFDHDVTMAEAAETGTRKVISEHSTIGLVMTTDGSITEIPRSSYIAAEERVVSELRELGKPFALVLNCENPRSPDAQKLRSELAEKYNVSCIAVNCLELGGEDIEEILRQVLYEFPLRELGISLPAWVDALPALHPLKAELLTAIRESCAGMWRIRDAAPAVMRFGENSRVEYADVREIYPDTGCVLAEADLPRSLFYETLSERSGFAVGDDGDLLRLLTDMSGVKSEYDRVKDALAQVRETGYGIVMPGREELKLAEPEIVRRGGRYAVRLRATAPSIHMILANIETEVSPAIGSERQSEDLINYLLQEFEGNTGKIWDSNIFGKPLFDIAAESLTGKLEKLPEDARGKLQEALQRIVNEGSAGLICIIL